MSVLEKIMLHRKVKQFAALLVTLLIFSSIVCIGYTVAAEESSQQTQAVSVQSENELSEQTLTDDSMMQMNAAEKILIVLLVLIILAMLAGSVSTIILMLHKQRKRNALLQNEIEDTPIVGNEGEAL